MTCTEGSVAYHIYAIHQTHGDTLTAPLSTTIAAYIFACLHKIVCFVRQLPRILDGDIDDLRDPLLQIVRHPVQDSAPLVPVAARKAQHDGRSVKANEVDPSRDTNPAVFCRVAEQCAELLPAGAQDTQDRLFAELQLRACVMTNPRSDKLSSCLFYARFPFHCNICTCWDSNGRHNVFSVVECRRWRARISRLRTVVVLVL